MESSATHEWFKKQNKRTFIIERSSFAGMGKFASKWLGDNYSDPNYMGLSVSGIMMMNMFGIPVAGSDICGFNGATNPELCARWTVLGSFQPFSRNHNTIGVPSQEPYRFAGEVYEKGISYTDIMRGAIRNRYHMIRYFYTQLHLISQDSSSTSMLYQPLFFEFPEDNEAMENI